MNHFAGAICLAIVFVLNFGHSAHAMGCDNRGATDRLHYGSKVSGDQVTICAEYWWPQVVGPVKKSTQPVKKFTPKVDPNSFVVTPSKPKAFSYSERILRVGQVFAVATTAATHERKKLLIGRLAIVRFTPQKTLWSFGDGHRAISNATVHAFEIPGHFSVRARVTYGVKFRFLGSTKWFDDPRGIAIQTNTLTFEVPNSPAKQLAKTPRLVYFDCETTQRLGC
jgi:hypothetical protein